MKTVEDLFRAHAADVLAYALRRTDAASAEDVVSDVFLVAGRRPDRIPESHAQRRAHDFRSASSPGQQRLLLVVPDGVVAVRARLRGKRYERIEVSNNFARLRVGAYDWQFLR